MSGIGLYAIGLGLGTGLSVIGAAYGIGILARAALESTARQPEAANSILIQMILAAALIEGFTFFAILVFFNGMGNVGQLGNQQAGGEEHAELNEPAIVKSVSDLA